MLSGVWGLGLTFRMVWLGRLDGNCVGNEMRLFFFWK